MRPARHVILGLVVALLGLAAVTRLPSLDADPARLKSRANAEVPAAVISRSSCASSLRPVFQMNWSTK